MKRVALALFVCTLATAASAAVAHGAGGWRTVIVASDADTSEYGDVSLDASTTLASVRALRVVARVQGGALKTDVRVDCKRGESDAQRKRTIRIATGTYALPVPIVGGRCKVDLFGYSFERGSYSLTVQAR